MYVITALRIQFVENISSFKSSNLVVKMKSNNGMPPILTYEIIGNNIEDLNRISFDAKSKLIRYHFTLDQISTKKTSSNVSFDFYVMANGKYEITIHYFGLLIYEHKINVKPPYTSNNFTMLECIGKSESRWCKFHNLCINGTGPVFISEYKPIVGEVFLVPGARPPPFDPKELRIGDGNIQFYQSINQTLKGKWFSEPSFIFSRYFNSRMLWHNVMDFIVPAFWTMSSYYSDIKYNKWGVKNLNYGKPFDKNNHIIIYDDFDYTGKYYMPALTNNTILISKGFKDKPRCFSTGVIGLRKSEKSPNVDRDNSQSLLMPYEIDPKGVQGLRYAMLNLSHADLNCQPSNEHPVIIIIQRKTKREVRRLINTDEILNATKELCPFCDVKLFDLQKFDKLGQIRFICNVTALIGVHGSGLVHALWMSPTSERLPTALFEFFPYKYTCRTWYKQLADIAQIQYYPIHTLTLDQSRWEQGHSQSKVDRCHNNKGECERVRCHDFLRDQSIISDVKQYKKIVRPFFDQLEAARP